VDSLGELARGLSVAISPGNLVWTVVGVTLGTVVGILPGIGATASVALLVPFAATLGPANGLAMLCGIYYGTKYGGSTTSILLNVPGEPSAVVACLDGHPLARQGHAGRAIAMAAIASFAASVVGVIGLAVLLPRSATLALAIGPTEHLALVALGLSFIVLLIGRSPLRAAIATLLGLAVSFVGADIISGASRLTFGRIELLDGIGAVPLTVGLFAVGEALHALRAPDQTRVSAPRGPLIPTGEDLRASFGAIAIGSVVGFFVGIVPGAGATVAAFVAYALARRFARRPERFGHGAIEGVAAPEAANNAEPMGALVPLLTLGIAGSGTTAVLLSALPYWGIAPGALLSTQQPDLVWTLVASLLVGNLLLVLLNLPLAPVFAGVLRLSPSVLFTTVIAVSVIGVYLVERDPFDVFLVTVFGALGHVLRRADVPVAPLVLAFVLGSVAERDLRAALIIAGGDPVMLFGSPIAAVLWLGCAAVLLLPLARRLRGAPA
jgi:putative tricarboxylic transport membrane protein